MLISPRYVDALGWAASLHQGQRRLGKDVPYLAHVMAVSSLVWEDGGDEDQAIAGLLHDAIEDAGQNHHSIAERYGTAVADIVQDCTDPGKVPGSGLTWSWFRCKQRLIEALDHQPDTSLLVIAADKAHNARDHLLDGQRDPSHWQRTRAGVEASTWYFQKLHRQLRRRLPQSRSVELLGEAVEGLLELPEFGLLVPRGENPQHWAAAFEERQALSVA